MSITAETAKEHANDPAVLCCRAEEGITIQASNLEDPAIFDELVDSGLLSLDGCLTIGQVLGATLTKTSDSLCPLTADNVGGFKEVVEEEEPASEQVEEAVAADINIGGAVTTIKKWKSCYFNQRRKRYLFRTSCLIDSFSFHYRKRVYYK